MIIAITQADNLEASRACRSKVGCAGAASVAAAPEACEEAGGAEEDPAASEAAVSTLAALGADWRARAGAARPCDMTGAGGG